jgi:transcription-repair coupling factor (superfamily II helicase)
VIVAESERFISILSDFSRDHELPLKQIFTAAEVEGPGILYIHRERMSAGFIEEGRFALVTDEEIFGFSRRRTRAAQKKAFNTNISDLSEGDYVVHIDYGIGIYQGLKHKVIGGIEGDYLDVLYDSGELLLVPLEQISQIQKYIGIGDAKPRIASLQSANWSKLKASARKYAAKIAQDLLKLYAERKARKGFAFKDSGAILSDFEERFAYDETEDQLSAIMDVYNDMEQEIPMDRLVCGDVGFGKTEVAMRAAMKAVAAGKQVAMLVPTTVLARQHYNTFKERFKDFPVTVDYISRFRTSEEIRKIRADLASGKLDILIGTHRILSKDMEFHDLHLLVIDEEQRFGVAHKEKIAAMRTNIDALSMSATPIPRTLQMSLSGIKDISTIETPPRDRQPVAVKVIGGAEDVKQAVTRELERGGQVFFLHNRINDIAECAEMLRHHVPHARIAIAHGQTPTKELDRVLSLFYEGEIDILVSTTIIENGIDIPNVNAIIIDNAANFGLSQLYQLKGRVGRSARRGYCYLLVNNFNSLTPIAKKRLSIVQQLSDLGSGLKIAMYDLQLRGAGDILGAAQSGFVVKVGYELFIKMIAEAVATLQETEQGIETEVITQFAHYIAADYIEDPHLRLDYYRRFSAATDRLVMDELFEELSLGYGELKKETIHLGYIMLIKSLAAHLKIKKAGIYLKMLRLTFAENAVINPALLMKTASDMGVQYRFSGEYELILSFDEESRTLAGGVQFLEKLAAG